ncbi:hypothetical protein EVAR_47524_1 [Eumeta japonica]|uniref:Uncharacterized protein n=1 Tax=Eumeta variegata TaxID=151549 RepID=A0A4C1XTX6_EUMVA|nr:hypothetical protein EVAR_47524_1 [Eumeta japonica]
MGHWKGQKAERGTRPPELPFTGQKVTAGAAVVVRILRECGKSPVAPLSFHGAVALSHYGSTALKGRYDDRAVTQFKHKDAIRNSRTIT